MSKTVLRVDTLFILQIVVAVFLVTLGLSGLIDYDSGLSRSAGTSTACSAGPTIPST